MRILLVILLAVSLLNGVSGQSIDFVKHVEDENSIDPDQFYLVKNQSLNGKVILRTGEYSVLKGFDIAKGTDSVYTISNEWKLAKSSSEKNQKGGVHYVKLYDSNKGLTSSSKEIEIVKIDGDILLVRIQTKEAFDFILEDTNVVFMQPSDREPKVETLIRQHDLGDNGVALTHHLNPQLDGSGLALSVKENAYDSSDFDITRRSTRDNFSSTTVELHATEMATLVAGNGSTYRTGRGVAQNASLYSTSFSSLLPESSSYYSDRNITVQNHSYGVQIENFYGVESEAYDETAISNKELLHVFSIGNSGLVNGTGNYTGVKSYGTITGSFKQAKNVILVSSTDSLGSVSELNSRGPAYDGRIKPDLVAFGGEGTSEAAAIVSGASALLQQKHLQNEGSMPPSDLVRALLIGGATDIDDLGPNFISGYGELNLFQSIQILDSGWFVVDEIVGNQPISLTLSIPQNIDNAKVVVTWNDTPANPGESFSLVNDLDMKVEKDGVEYLPWILDSTPTLSLLENTATKGVDHLNNTEMVTIPNPESGDYTLTVSSFSNVTQQPFSVAYSFEEANSFQWMYPTGSDPLEGGRKERIHWRTTSTGQATLEINYLGEDWYDLSGEVDLESRFMLLQLPDTTSLCKIRMSYGTMLHESDTFLINRRASLEVDLNCTEDLILKWPNISVDSYSIRKFTGGNIEEVGVTSDTFMIIDRNVHTGQFFSVLPRFWTKNGSPSFLINVDQQGVDCFNNSFLVTLAEEGVVDIKIELSGISQIEEASILKSTKGKDFEILQSWSPQTESITIQDANLTNGVIAYQLRIETLDGHFFYSAVEEISFTKAYFAAPNYVRDGFFNWFSPASGGILQLTDQGGKIVAEYDIVNEIEEIEVTGLKRGQYYYRVIKNGSILSKGKLIIQ